MENTVNEKMISEIHLIRHGNTEGTEKRWFYGSIDIPLSNSGVDQLARLAKIGYYPCQEYAERMVAEAAMGKRIANPAIPPEDPTPDFYTSGMLRTDQTFFIIYGNAPHKTIEELKEINFGDFEGHSHEELSGLPAYENWLKMTGEEAAPPNGESVGQFGERIKKGWEKLVGLHELKELSHRHSKLPAHSVVVCHGGVIGGLMMHLFPEEGRHLYAWLPEPGHGYSIIMDHGTVIGYREF